MDQVLLMSPPSDGISQLTFSNSTNLLLASSWDKKVRLYDASANALLHDYSHSAAVLCCRFVDDVHSISGGLDRVVKYYNFDTSSEEILGKHDNSVSCLRYSKDHNLVISGSWDHTIKCFDIRDSSKEVRTLTVPDKVYSMGMSNTKLVVATANRQLVLYDLNNMEQPLETRESSLLYQTRCVECFPNDTGYAVSSVEGRVALEYFDPQMQSKKFAFKCHRQLENGVEMAYPVNTISFHPIYGTFATGGGDGMVNIWDGVSRKKTAQYSRYLTSISSLCFNHDGTLLATAVSYTYEQGDLGHPLDQIYIRSINDKEVRQKERKN